MFSQFEKCKKTQSIPTIEKSTRKQKIPEPCTFAINQNNYQQV